MIEPSATRVAPWHADQRKLWSMLQMIEFYGHTFVQNMLRLHDGYRAIHEQALSDAANTELTEDNKRHLRDLVSEMEHACRDIDMEAAAMHARIVGNRLLRSGPPCNAGVMDGMLNQLLSQINAELVSQRFAFVPQDRQEYFEQHDPFQLAEAFPSIESDFRDAGNAYAMGLHTAAVFHLMRVAEIGLRRFARHLRIRLPRNKGPIEWAIWEDILRQIQARVDEMSGSTRSTRSTNSAKSAKSAKSKPKKSADRAFYRGLLAEFQGFKDAYRNDVMHVRKTYAPYEAQTLFERVGEFMRRLATRVHE